MQPQGYRQNSTATEKETRSGHIHINKKINGGKSIPEVAGNFKFCAMVIFYYSYAAVAGKAFLT